MIKKLLFILTIFCLLGFTPPSAPYDDPPDANTSLQLSFDEADTSTTTDDESANNFTITNNGNVQTDSGITKFSNTSLFDGTGDFWSIPDNALWAFGTTNFTFDGWLRLAVDPGASWDEGVFSQTVDGSNMTAIALFGGAIRIYHTVAGVDKFHFVGSTALVKNTWYHYAWHRYGTGANNMRLYINGTEESLTWSTNLAASYSIPDFAAVLKLGYEGVTGTYWNGNMDEFRISTNIARDWAVTRRIIMVVYGTNIGSPNMIGTPLWSCKIKLQSWIRNLRG